MADDPGAMKWAIDAFKNRDLEDRYHRYRRYYRGDHELAFASPKYAQTFGQLFREFSYNRCATVVDAFANRLKVERFVVEQAGADETAGDLWRRNRMDKSAGEVHRAVLRDGDSYVSVWPETGMQFNDGGAFPDIWPQHAHCMRVRYDDARPGHITLAAKSWVNQASGRRYLTLFFPDRTEKYVTRGRSTSIRSDAFERYQPPEDATWPVRNRWETVPVFHFGNDADTGDYGTSELRAVIPLQNALNKEVNDLLLASELSAYPVKVLLGFDHNDAAVTEAAARIETGRSKILLVPPGPGGEKPAIDEFTAENLQQIIAAIEHFDKSVSRVATIPLHHLLMTGDFPSGRAMRTAESQFINKVEDRQTAYGNVWEDAMHLALRMAGVADPGLLSTVWKPAAPLSLEDQLDMAVIKNAIGIPFEQIVRELGYDEEEIAAMTEQKDKEAAQQVAMFSTAAAGGETLQQAADTQEPTT